MFNAHEIFATRVKRGKAIEFPHGIEFCAEGMRNIVSRQKSLAPIIPSTENVCFRFI